MSRKAAASGESCSVCSSRGASERLLARGAACQHGLRAHARQARGCMGGAVRRACRFRCWRLVRRLRHLPEGAAHGERLFRPRGTLLARRAPLAAGGRRWSTGLRLRLAHRSDPLRQAGPAAARDRPHRVLSRCGCPPPKTLTFTPYKLAKKGMFSDFESCPRWVLARGGDRTAVLFAPSPACGRCSGTARRCWGATHGRSSGGLATMRSWKVLEQLSANLN